MLNMTSVHNKDRKDTDTETHKEEGHMTPKAELE